MRIRASFEFLLLFSGIASAQDTVKTEFATDESRPPIAPITVTVLPPPTVAPVAVVPTFRPMGYSAEQLLHMSECELVQVYKCGVPSVPPCGYVPGKMIFQPGSAIAVPTSRLIGLTFWQGKWIPGDGTMVNRMFGLPAIKAVVASGESFIDGKPSTIFDYHDTSFVWRYYRDELREVSPGVYLGCMHWVGWCGPKVATWFALDTVNESSRCKGCGK
jgi:hypothetical protein